MNIDQIKIRVEKHLPHVSVIKILDHDKKIIELFCNKHSIKFKKRNADISRTLGCPICRRESYALKRTFTNEMFIEKSNEKHKYKYDYSKVKYVSCSEKVEIICKKHGSFWQAPAPHFRGIGCPICKRENISKALSYSFEKWDELLNKKHNNLYSYVNNFTEDKKLEIHCKKHGVFFQLPSIHLLGHGCPKCANEFNSIRSFKTQEETIVDFKKSHGDLYDYSFVVYRSAKEKVEIKCKEHGSFWQTPNDHKSGYGCPYCSQIRSHQEKEVCDFIKELDESIVENVRYIIPPKEIDIFVPNKNLAIEFNGNYWHSFNKEETEKEKNYHANKTILCKEKNIELLHMFEFEWKNVVKREIWKSIIKNKLNKISNIIDASECVVKEISDKEFNNFCTHNNLNGVKLSKIKIGLFYNNAIISVMGICSNTKHQWEITRYCNLNNISIFKSEKILFDYFKEKFTPREVLFVCDFRLSDGKNFENIGFKHSGLSSPNYFYVKDEEIYVSRFKCYKENLKKILPIYDETLTEFSNMINNNYRRVWDCGHIKFIWNEE
jgi:hypothetical protein